MESGFYLRYTLIVSYLGVNGVDAVRGNYYHKHISEAEPTTASMPLVHVCDSFTFRKIMVSGVIAPSYCKVFEKDLSYFFYGRPSYRVSSQEQTTNAKSMFPICFILEPSSVSTISDAYPFDTGAFCAGIFSGYVHPKSEVSDYKFINQMDFIQRFVGYFYSNNTSYYDGLPSIAQQNLPAMAFELHSLYQLITTESNEKFDDRCHTIEIQTEEDVDINSGAIKAMVLPASIASDPEVASFMFDKNIEPIIYHTTRCAPSDLSTTIIDHVRNFYKTEGVVAS
ncbi:hypothetical protein [Vibrio vulnificus]|uniref:hypothetical protein n=1 Tax=Vibrio vulnificus TaxID=672 RepID=UPI0018DCD7A1|nr:hypothetical protein [Vibrio vulnificus]HAS3594620.1 hypothetical protein [Vibrio cholerae]